MAVETIQLFGVEHLPELRPAFTRTPRPYDWAVDEPRPFDYATDIDENVGFFINDDKYCDIRTAVLPQKNLAAQMDADTVNYIDKKIRASFSAAGTAEYITGLLITIDARNPQQWGVGVGSMIIGMSISSLGKRFTRPRQQR